MSETATSGDTIRVDLLRAAIRYAERGYHVFPVHSVRAGGVCSCGAPQCGRVGKHPRTHGGFKEATVDKDQITKWWLENPDANIGLVPWPSGLIVLDIDPRNGGTESLADLEKKYGALPDTARVFTGGGGLHIYFTRPTGVDKVPSRVLRPGVELKAMSGYIIAPPSSHLSVYLNAGAKEAGPGYQWDGALGDLMADCPFWVCEAPPPGKVYERNGRPPIEGVLGCAFVHAGKAGRMLGLDKQAVECPWESDHTGGDRFDTSTVVFGPSQGNNLGFFHCSHAHCEGKTIREVLAALPKDSVEHAKSVVPQAARILSTVAAEDWERLLARKNGGSLGTDPGNLRLLMENLPEWQGALALDESRGKMIWRKEIPEVPGALKSRGARLGHELRDGDYIDVGHWFRIVRGVTFRKEVIMDVLHNTAERCAFNSLTEYLDGLRPDPKLKLLDNWLIRYCGAEDTPYTRSVGRWWLISAMARAFEPGVQVDHCLVLEGRQGAGKSTLFKLLGGQWYDGTPPKFESTDALMSFQGIWIREFSELAGAGRTEFATIKALMTERVDRFRPPYGRHFVEHPRRCVFCASVNPGDDYIRDATGARRFWPVKLPHEAVIDTYAFARDRDQLLGEALQAYRDGEPFHPPQMTAANRELVESIQDIQGARQVADPWADTILACAQASPDGVTMEQLFGALQVPMERREQREAKRIGVILRAHGYERRKRRNPLTSGNDDRFPGNTGQHYVWVLS
jgi:hypothetical protein